MNHCVQGSEAQGTLSDRFLRIEAIKNIQPHSYKLNNVTKREAKTIFQNFELVEKSFKIDFFESSDTRKKPRIGKKILKNANNTILSVSFSGKSIGKLRSFFSYKRENIIYDTREIFKYSKYAYSSNYIITEARPDGSFHKEHSNIEAYHHFVNKIHIENESYYVRFTVKEERKSKGKLHSAHVSEISIINEKSRESSRSLLGNDQGGTAHPAYDKNLVEFLDSVN
ncbi:MAG: hypothetical protein FWD22_01295 [Treponema sp.]|nr:hypothetical protein [Treponema sp.]